MPFTPEQVRHKYSLYVGRNISVLVVFWVQKVGLPKKWGLLLIANVWLRQSETVFSKCSVGNMSEGSKPNIMVYMSLSRDIWDSW